MVKKIIFISFSIFIVSCSAIGRGILIDSILNNVHKELEQEKKRWKKEKPTIKSLNRRKCWQQPRRRRRWWSKWREWAEQLNHFHILKAFY